MRPARARLTKTLPLIASAPLESQLPKCALRAPGSRPEPGRSCHRSRSRRRNLGEWKGEGEPRAPAPVLGADRATVRFDDPLADGQAQAAPPGAARPERVEDAIQVTRRDRGSLILDPRFEHPVPLRRADLDLPAWGSPLVRVLP